MFIYCLRRENSYSRLKLLHKLLGNRAHLGVVYPLISNRILNRSAEQGNGSMIRYLETSLFFSKRIGDLHSTPWGRRPYFYVQKVVGALASILLAILLSNGLVSLSGFRDDPMFAMKDFLLVYKQKIRLVVMGAVVGETANHFEQVLE
jgi:hypothetical protein